MATNASDVMVETLISWGVDVIFGLPGDGINGIIEALRQRQDKIRFIQVRHEEAAAFMACGYAKVTGKLGVCLATSGPGGIHLLNGLYDAKLDGQPVLAITGMQFHDLIDTHTQQDVELDKLFMDVAVYNCRVMGPAHIENVTDLACRTALSARGVAHITIPVDIQTMKVGRMRSERNVSRHTSHASFRSTSLPNEESLKQAAAILNEGSRVAILVGQGALGAAEELSQVAKILAAPVIKALLGKGVLPDDHPHVTGGIGLLGTSPSQAALETCDTLFIVGSSFPYIEYLPRPGRARGVQIDIDPVRLGLRYPVEVGLTGDSKRILQALLPLLVAKSDQGFLSIAQDGVKEWNKLLHAQETRTSKPMKPQVVAAELGARISDTAIVACDSGTIATWWARHIRVRPGQIHTLSGNLATMACGLPYAIAAQVAYPDRQVVAFVGDGGLSMLMAEFATCVKYKLPIKVVVMKNNSLGQIKWEQMVFLGNPEYVCDLQPIDFKLFAQACGGEGISIEEPEKCGPALEGALMNTGPMIVEAVIDPFEPPMPARVSVKQAAHFAESLIRGEPNRGKIALTVVSDRIKEIV